MVLNDVVKEYKSLYDVLKEHCGEGSLIEAGFKMLTKYNSSCNKAIDTYMRSKMHTSDLSGLENSLRGLVSSFSSEIATMNNNVRKTTRLITAIDHIVFQSNAVELYAAQICEGLEQILDLIEAYASNKIQGISTISIFFQIIEKLSEIQVQYETIVSNYEFLNSIEDELCENDIAMLEDEDSEEYYLEIRSNKKSTKINTFADDIQFLNECLNLFEQVISQGDNKPIYMLKLESGSLFSKLKSSNINISVLPSIVKNFADAMYTFRMTGAEVECKKAEAELNLANADKIKAETETIRTDNKVKKLEIVNSQMDRMMELLQIDKSDNNSKELLEKFGISLLNYMEANPQGEMNGVKYDISECVKLLEKKVE